MTAPDLDALARETIALGERATRGPWFRGKGEHWSRDVRAGDNGGVAFCGHADFDADAALIAAYRTSAPALAQALLAAREAMREAHAALDASLGGYTKSERADGLTKSNDGSPFALSVRALARLESALRSGAGEKETT